MSLIVMQKGKGPREIGLLAFLSKTGNKKGKCRSWHRPPQTPKLEQGREASMLRTRDQVNKM